MTKNYNSDMRHLVAINSLIDFAEQLPLELLLDKNPKPIYPITVSERLVNYVLDIVLTTEWEEDSNEEAVDQIGSILSQLDISVTSEEEWRKLFDSNKVLAQWIGANT